MPQGIVIVPTLFLIYINVLCMLKLHNGNIYAFANDTAQNILREYTCTCVSVRSNWARCRIGSKLLVTLNTGKTKYIEFTLKSSNLHHVQHPYTITAYTCPIPYNTGCSYTFHQKTTTKIFWNYTGRWYRLSFSH